MEEGDCPSAEATTQEHLKENKVRADSFPAPILADLRPELEDGPALPHG